MTAYSDIPAVNNSWLGSINKVSSEGMEEAYRFGILTHKIALEPEKVTKQDIKHPQFNNALALSEEFNRHPLTQAVKATGQAKPEQLQHRVLTIESQNGYPDFTLAAKCRHDILCESLALSVDLKTTSCNSMAQIKAAMSRFNYDRAAYWYMMIGELQTMVFLFVSKSTREVFAFVVRKNDPVYLMGKQKAQIKLYTL